MYQVIKPELQVTTSVTPTIKVNPLQLVVFTAVLSHTAQSTSHAYRVLFEMALPHELVAHVSSSIKPSGKITIVSGSKAPSGSAR